MDVVAWMVIVYLIGMPMTAYLDGLINPFYRNVGDLIAFCTLWPLMWILCPIYGFIKFCYWVGCKMRPKSWSREERCY